MENWLLQDAFLPSSLFPRPPILPFPLFQTVHLNGSYTVVSGAYSFDFTFQNGQVLSLPSVLPAVRDYFGRRGRRFHRVLAFERAFGGAEDRLALSPCHVQVWDRAHRLSWLDSEPVSVLRLRMRGWAECLSVGDCNSCRVDVVVLGCCCHRPHFFTMGYLENVSYQVDFLYSVSHPDQQLPTESNHFFTNQTAFFAGF